MKSWFWNTNLVYYLIFGRSPCVYPRVSHFATFSFHIFFLLYISKPAWTFRLRTCRPCASEDVAAIRETGLKSGNDGARETQEMSEGEDRSNQDVDEMYSGKKRQEEELKYELKVIKNKEVMQRADWGRRGGSEENIICLWNNWFLCRRPQQNVSAGLCVTTRWQQTQTHASPNQRGHFEQLLH